MAIPLHSDHLQPSDMPALAEILRRTQIVATLTDIDGNSDNGDLLASFTCPCDGLLENPFMTIATTGSADKIDVHFAKNGVSVLSADMSIANDDPSPTTVVGTFATDQTPAARTCLKGDIITVMIPDAAAADSRNLTASVTFVALGRE